MTPDDELIDPFLGMPVTTRVVHPFQATKPYVCPGCNTDIPVGTGHLVVVPKDAAELRRHWHRDCWSRRDHLTRNDKKKSGAKKRPR